MRQLVIFLIVSALFLGQGFSVAAAMCRHGSAREHAMARDSRDGKVAAAAKAEDTAASVVERKGALAGSSSLYSQVADLPPALALAERGPNVRGLPWHGRDVMALDGEAQSPLLRPPLT